MGSVAAGMKAIRFLFMPAPKTRWSWRGMKYSSSVGFSMAWEAWLGFGGRVWEDKDIWTFVSVDSDNPNLLVPIAGRLWDLQ